MASKSLSAYSVPRLLCHVVPVKNLGFWLKYRVPNTRLHRTRDNTHHLSDCHAWDICADNKPPGGVYVCCVATTRWDYWFWWVRAPIDATRVESTISNARVWTWITLLLRSNCNRRICCTEPGNRQRKWRKEGMNSPGNKEKGKVIRLMPQVNR